MARADREMEPWRAGLSSAVEGREDDLIEALGVDRVTVWRWKVGERWPEPGMVLRICEALGLTPNELYGVKRLPAPRPTRRQLDEAVTKLYAVIALFRPGESDSPAADQLDPAPRFKAMRRAGRKAMMRQRRES